MKKVRRIVVTQRESLLLCAIIKDKQGFEIQNFTDVNNELQIFTCASPLEVSDKILELSDKSNTAELNFINSDTNYHDHKIILAKDQEDFKRYIEHYISFLIF